MAEPREPNYRYPLEGILKAVVIVGPFGSYEKLGAVVGKSAIDTATAQGLDKMIPLNGSTQTAIRIYKNAGHNALDTFAYLFLMPEDQWRELGEGLSGTSQQRTHEELDLVRNAPENIQRYFFDLLTTREINMYKEGIGGLVPDLPPDIAEIRAIHLDVSKEEIDMMNATPIVQRVRMLESARDQLRAKIGDPTLPPAGRR